MRITLKTILLLLLVTALSIRGVQSADYTPLNLEASVYVDGVIGITYNISVDPTLARVSIPLFGSQFSSLLVLNENNIPLVNVVNNSSIAVDTLGASGLQISYITQDLTKKIGTLWTFNITAPGNIDVLLPSGATIVSLSQIPINIQTVEGRSSVTFPAGPLSVSYIVTAMGTKEHAQVTIQDAEVSINLIKAGGVSTKTADSLLAQSKTSFNTGDYLKADLLASQAKEAGLEAETQRNIADNAIKNAQSAIDKAKTEGRTSKLSDAQNLLQNAKSSYETGDYTKTVSLADQASQTAANSVEGNNTLLLFGAGAAIIGVAVIILMRRRGKSESKPSPPKSKEVEGSVNFEMIFSKNSDLRVDDKEVIRFLSDRGGEAFANEIRDRFDIPRTTAWRMIRRLIGMGIVEEKKIGGQSLIFIVKKYRGEPKV
ncbi:MAG: hypothetical protein NTV15_08145 [Candidatus Bathyarchaeota archaeon]|nr:hypothetical protein [Candidatus Bathyarchaeota archaeon]